MVTAIVSPIFTILFRPAASRYIVHRRRTVLHSHPDEGINILACIHSQTNVPSIVNLLEASNPIPSSPIVVFAVHIVELVGRAAPIMISHTTSSHPSHVARAATESDYIINALQFYEQRHGGAAAVHPYTAVAPYHTIHDDVCQLALTRGVVLIIFPFHKIRQIDGHMEGGGGGVRVMNRNLLLYAPCSVGVLVDRAPGTSLCTLTDTFEHNVAMFFFGGEDDREALAYVNRMAKHPGVCVTAIRFLSSSTILVGTREAKMDNEVFVNFRAQNAGNPRLVHREVVVADMEQILGVIRGMDIDSYDLFVVGMRHESNRMISDSMSGWSESPELGVIGDLLASPDFGSTTSILVIRQQISTLATASGAWQEDDVELDGQVSGPSPPLLSPIRLPRRR